MRTGQSAVGAGNGDVNADGYLLDMNGTENVALGDANDDVVSSM